MGDCLREDLSRFNDREDQGNTRIGWRDSMMTEQDGHAKMVRLISVGVKRAMQIRRHREQRSAEHQQRQHTGQSGGHPVASNGFGSARMQAD